MNNYILIPLTAFLINGFVWIFIYSQKGSRINRAFLYYASALAVWLLSVIAIRWVTASYLILPLMKIGSIGWLSISFLFLHFLYVFIEKKKDAYYYYSFAVSVISIVINFSSGFITNGYLNTYWGPDEQHGFLFIPVVILTICIPAFYAIYLMIAEKRKSLNSNIKKSLNLMLWGSCISLVIGLSSNVFLPVIIKTVSIVKVGESGTVFQSIFIFIAIIKYKFFTISGVEEVAEDIYSNIQDAVIVMDVNGNLLQFNSACETLFEREIEPGNKIHINTLLPNHNFLNAFQDKQKSIQVNGRWKHLSLTQASVSYQNIEKGKILIIRDETKRKEAELEIIKAKDAAEELNRLKAVFLTNMSHELRTPLISIIGYAELLSDEIENNEHKTMTGEIAASGKRLVDTLNSILELSRIESNEINLNLKFINLNSLIKELIIPFADKAKLKGISLELHLQSNSPEVVVDKKLFEAAFNHLISNAVKFTKEGNIKIETTTEPVKESKWAVIKVTDTGIGISKEELPVIFDPFRQASEGLSRKYEGAGLGLTLAKKFIELMKGTILVISEPGKGSSFFIKLPFTHRQKKTEASEKTKALIKNLREQVLPEILLIDDDSVSIFIIRDSLKDFYNLEVCIVPETAVLLASRTKYAAVIINYSLNAGTNKLETLSKLTTLKNYKAIPFIAVVSEFNQTVKEHLLMKGFTNIIESPVNPAKLAGIIPYKVK